LGDGYGDGDGAAGDGEGVQGVEGGEEVVEGGGEGEVVFDVQGWEVEEGFVDGFQLGLFFCFFVVVAIWVVHVGCGWVGGPDGGVVVYLEGFYFGQVDQWPEGKCVGEVGWAGGVGCLEGDGAQGGADVEAWHAARELGGGVILQLGAEPGQGLVGCVVDCHAEGVKAAEVAEQGEEHGLAEADIQRRAIWLVPDFLDHVLPDAYQYVEADGTAIQVLREAG
jgi:hypothetical protein